MITSRSLGSSHASRHPFSRDISGDGAVGKCLFSIQSIAWRGSWKSKGKLRHTPRAKGGAIGSPLLITFFAKDLARARQSYLDWVGLPVERERHGDGLGQGEVTEAWSIISDYVTVEHTDGLGQGRVGVLSPKPLLFTVSRR